jgi:hypothetical protein
MTRLGLGAAHARAREAPGPARLRAPARGARAFRRRSARHSSPLTRDMDARPETDARVPRERGDTALKPYSGTPTTTMQLKTDSPRLYSNHPFLIHSGSRPFRDVYLLPRLIATCLTLLFAVCGPRLRSALKTNGYTLRANYTVRL